MIKKVVRWFKNDLIKFCVPFNAQNSVTFQNYDFSVTSGLMSINSWFKIVDIWEGSSGMGRQGTILSCCILDLVWNIYVYRNVKDLRFCATKKLRQTYFAVGFLRICRLIDESAFTIWSRTQSSISTPNREMRNCGYCLFLLAPLCAVCTHKRQRPFVCTHTH